jgi:DNA polymerase III delta' subunit
MSQKTVAWKNLIAQDHVKEMLSNAYGANSLGHAYLFCGDPGVGKFCAALELACALLCESNDQAPCYTCANCRKVLNNTHPDFHVILPVSLDPSHKASDNKLSQKGWEYLTSLVQEKIAAPYVPLTYKSVPSIPVEWLKEVNHAILRGSVSGPRTVAILSGVDVMGKESANAMLKTLEEPPANTYLILTSDRPQAVLPTIVSRCQIVRFGHVPFSHIQEVLAQTMGVGADERTLKRAVHYSMGSLGRALSLASANLEETAIDVKAVWTLCVSGDWQDIVTAIDERTKQNDFEAADRFFTYMLYLIRNSFLQKSSGSETYIDVNDILLDVGNVFNNPFATERLTGACNEAIAGIRAYGNIATVFVHFIMTIMEILHGEKQQAG